MFVAPSHKSGTHHPPDNFRNVRTHTSEASGDHTPLGGFFRAAVHMSHYRIVTINYEGQLSRHRGFKCENDDDAIVWAKQLVDVSPVELWCGARFVARLEPPPPTKRQ